MNQSILLVEDEAALRMTLIDRLCSEDYKVNWAGDGDDALAKAASLPFDLILLDPQSRIDHSHPHAHRPGTDR